MAGKEEKKTPKQNAQPQEQPKPTNWEGHHDDKAPVFRVLHGRQKITIGYEEINDTNIVDTLLQTFPIFQSNAIDIEYLFNYYKGNQPIINKVKKVRPEINNIVVENHANSIVQFKVGYLLEKPIQYVARKDAVDNKSMYALNDYLEIIGKEGKDRQIAHDQAVCGTAFRLALPNRRYEIDSDESPFRVATVYPANAYVVYSTLVDKEPLLGVIIYKKRIEGRDHTILQAYSNVKYWEYDMTANALLKSEAHPYGYIPLIEYPYSDERVGAFEIVIPLLDAINKVQSNRLDGVEQFIQALLVFKNSDIEKEELKELLELGAIKISDTGELKANIEYLTQELNQEQTQVLKNDLLDVVYHIVGMPSRTKSGGGDTGTAVIYRNGWEEADSKIQDVELMFKESEKQFLKIILSYTRTLTLENNKLKLSDIEVKFTRRNFENTYQKTQILDMMLKNGKIAPRLAFVTCGLFQDPESVYAESEEYVKEKAQTMPTPPVQPTPPVEEEEEENV